MKKDETEKLLADFFARFGKASFAFGQSNFVKANIGEAVIGFEYQKDEQTLTCRALIYRFRRQPRTEILRQITVAAENDRTTDAGDVSFDPQSLTLSLVKNYSRKINSRLFAAQMQQLAATSLIWSSTILGQVAAKSGNASSEH